MLVLDPQLIIHSLVKKLDTDLHSLNLLGLEFQQSMLTQELDTLVLLLSLLRVVDQVLVLLEHGRMMELVYQLLSLLVLIPAPLMIQIYRELHTLVLLDHSKVFTLVMV